MATINFKSVGKTQEQQVIETLVKSPTPIGIKTPLRPGGEEGIFSMNFSLVDQLRDNLRNLVQTNWGERLGFYDYGANLRPLMSEFVSQDDFDAQAVERISGAVQRWLPFISLDTLESSVIRPNASVGSVAIIKMTIAYSIPALNAKNQVIEVFLYAM